MAFTLNTIEYGWGANTVAQSGSTVYATPTKRIYVPETTSRTFINADVEMYMADANNGTTISSISAFALTGSIDGNLFGDRATAGALTATSNHTTLRFKSNFTSQFNQRFTGSSHDVLFRFQLPQANSGTWIGHSFKLILTYRYDDETTNTAIKTVRIPLDSHPNALTTTNTVLGRKTANYASVPNLDSFLPESSKVYRDLFFECNYHDQFAAVGTAKNIFITIDSGSESTRFSVSNGLGMDRIIYDIYNVSGTMATSASHTIAARATNNTTFGDLSLMLFATYEYDYTGSQSVMNSLYFPSFDSIYTYNQRPQYFASTFLVPEPNPSLQQSALIITGMNALTANLRVGISNQILTPISITRGSPYAGQYYRYVRFDDNALSASAYTINSGYNQLTSIVTGTTANISKFSAYGLLNYSSSRLSSLRGHNRIIYLSSGSIDGYASVTSPISNNHITSSLYGTDSYINSVQRRVQTNTSTQTHTIIHNVDYTGSLTISASNSIVDIISLTLSSADLMMAERAINVTPSYRQYASQSIEAQSYFARHNSSIALNSGVYRPFFVTDYISMNQNKIGVTGSLLNCNFPSTNYEVLVYLSGSRTPLAPIYTLTSSGSTSTKTFNFDWYENVNKLYVVTKYPEHGISNLATASNGNILTLDYATTGGEKSFTFIG